MRSIRGAGILGEREDWPKLRKADIELMEKLYPPRCLLPRETVEDHLRYAGIVWFIERLKAHIPAEPTALALTPEEIAEADDAAAIEVAERTLNTQEEE